MKSSEAIPLYIVRFMRLDDYPDEEYNYIRKSDAEKHFSMYPTDNSGLYYEIQLSEVRNKTAKILNAKLLLPLSLTELHILKEYGTSDQLETCMALKLLVDRCQISNPYAAINARVAIERLSPKQYLRFFTSLESLKV